MNIYEAWKALKSGRNVFNTAAGERTVDYWEQRDFKSFVITNGTTLENWEVRKAHRIYSTKIDIKNRHFNEGYYDTYITKDIAELNNLYKKLKEKGITAKLTIEWEE